MRVSSTEWIMMAAELAVGLVIAFITGWSLLASCGLAIAVGVALQLLYRRNLGDREQAAWLFECAYTLWRQGGLSLRTSIFWAEKLKTQFGDRWSGRRAAEHQLLRWNN